jgi:hypothetical protein
MARVARAVLGWRLLAGVLLALLVVAGVRCATFDVEATASAILGQLDPLSPDDVGGLRAIASARDDSTVVEELGALDVDAMERRFEIYTRTLARLRDKYHRGDGHCARYPAGDEISEQRTVAVADALVEAGLQDVLTEVLVATVAWDDEVDEEHHADAAADELLEDAIARAGPWDRAGFWLRRAAVRRHVEERGRSGAAHVSKLSADDEERARAIWEQHGGPVIRKAALVVVRRKRERRERRERLEQREDDDPSTDR